MMIDTEEKKEEDLVDLVGTNASPSKNSSYAKNAGGEKLDSGRSSSHAKTLSTKNECDVEKLFNEANAVIEQDMKFLEENDLLETVAEDIDLMGSNDGAALDKYISLKAECAHYKLRAGLAESKCEELQEKLHEMWMKKEENTVQQLEPSLHQIFDLLKKQYEGGAQVQAASMLSQESKDHHSLIVAENTIQDLKAQLEQAKMEGLLKEKQLEDLKEAMHKLEQSNVEAREKYELALNNLRQETFENLQKRREEEKQEKDRFENEVRDLEKKCSEKDKTNAVLKTQVQSLTEKLQLEANLKEKIASLLQENKDLKSTLDKANEEIAQIKLDLATRRSDEDDLIARLEQQAIEYNMAHQMHQQSGAGMSSSKTDNASWVSWFKS